MHRESRTPTSASVAADRTARGRPDPPAENACSSSTDSIRSIAEPSRNPAAAPAPCSVRSRAPLTSPSMDFPVMNSATARRSAPLRRAPCGRMAPVRRLSTMACGVRARRRVEAGRPRIGRSGVARRAACLKHARTVRRLCPRDRRTHEDEAERSQHLAQSDRAS